MFCSVWVARKPPGFAFIDFDDKRDAQDAIRELDGNYFILQIEFLGGLHAVYYVDSKYRCLLV